MKHKETGYHAFNLYAFALLRQRFPQHGLWRDPRLTQAMSLPLDPEFSRRLEQNPFGSSYNPVGFEFAFALGSFPEFQLDPAGSVGRKWVQAQLSRHWCLQENLLQRNTEDAACLAARLYEATRLQDMDLDIGEDPADA